MIQDDLKGTFVGSRKNVSTIKMNIAQVEIKIYDLKKLELISNSMKVGKLKVEVNEDSTLELFQNTTNIKSNSLQKLINKYKRKRIK